MCAPVLHWQTAMLHWWLLIGFNAASNIPGKGKTDFAATTAFFVPNLVVLLRKTAAIFGDRRVVATKRLADHCSQAEYSQSSLSFVNQRVTKIGLSTCCSPTRIPSVWITLPHHFQSNGDHVYREAECIGLLITFCRLRQFSLLFGIQSIFNAANNGRSSLWAIHCLSVYLLGRPLRKRRAFFYTYHQHTGGCNL